MWKCPNCGNMSDGNFCGECGKPMPAPVEEPTYTPNPVYTPPAETGYAPALEQPPATGSEPIEVPPVVIPGNNQVPVKDNKSKAIIFAVIGIGVVVVAVIVATIVLFVGRAFMGNNTQPEPQDVVIDVDNDEPYEVEEEDYTEIDTDVIEDIIDKHTDYTEFGIYVHNMENDYVYGYNEDDTFLASAMGQVVILNTLAQVAQEEDLDVDATTMRFDYIGNGKEAPDSPEEDGEYLTIRQYIEDVAVYGDNNKSNALVDCIAELKGGYNGFDVINDMLDDYGYTNTRINRKTFTDPALVDTSVSANMTTPEDIAELFRELINNGYLGSESYMKQIFKSVTQTGQPLGLKKFIPSYYTACNVNAQTNQCTNDVAIINDGDAEIIVAILTTTDESKTSVENYEEREAAQKEIIEYILDTQFE